MSTLPTQPEISTESPRGATITHAYGERKVKTYAVLESEMKSISQFNTQSTTFSSIASALFALAAAIWTNAAFVTEKTLPEMGRLMAWFGAPLLCALSIVFLVLGYNARKSRNEIWQTIDSETK